MCTCKIIPTHIEAHPPWWVLGVTVDYRAVRPGAGRSQLDQGWLANSLPDPSHAHAHAHTHVQMTVSLQTKEKFRLLHSYLWALRSTALDRHIGSVSESRMCRGMQALSPDTQVWQRLQWKTTRSLQVFHIANNKNMSTDCMLWCGGVMWGVYTQ